MRVEEILLEAAVRVEHQQHFRQLWRLFLDPIESAWEGVDAIKHNSRVHAGQPVGVVVMLAAAVGKYSKRVLVFGLEIAPDDDYGLQKLADSQELFDSPLLDVVVGQELKKVLAKTQQQVTLQK